MFFFRLFFFLNFFKKIQNTKKTTIFPTSLRPVGQWFLIRFFDFRQRLFLWAVGAEIAPKDAPRRAAFKNDTHVPPNPLENAFLAKNLACSGPNYGHHHATQGNPRQQLSAPLHVLLGPHEPPICVLIVFFYKRKKKILKKTSIEEVSLKGSLLRRIQT